jgi:hypothetical protein
MCETPARDSARRQIILNDLVCAGRGRPGRLYPRYYARYLRVCRIAWSVSPRTRVILIRDQIVTKVGGNVLGNPLSSVVAGTGPSSVLLAIQGAAGAVIRHEVTPPPLDGS